MTRAAIQVS